MRVMMIHGAGGGAWEFEQWQGVFQAAGDTCVVPELHPGSDGIENTTLLDYENQVIRAGADGVDVLIGASLGGVLALRTWPMLKPRAMVLIGTPPPAGIGIHQGSENIPAIVKWSESRFSQTVDAMPDCAESTILSAHSAWRDESGLILEELARGVHAIKPTLPTLCVIPSADDVVSVENQHALAEWAVADIIQWSGMSHLGALLSERAVGAAEMALRWISLQSS